MVNIKYSKTKRAVIGLILFTIVFGGIFAPFAAEMVYAQGSTEPQEGVGVGASPTQQQRAVFGAFLQSETEKKSETGNSLGACTFSLTNATHFELTACIAEGANLWLSALGYVTWVGGIVLDMGVHLSVVKMGEIGNLSQIGDIWTIFRDLGNILIIFSFLIIGIATILRITTYGMKELLARLIVIALLINFSLVAAQIVIDGGNIISLQIYDQLVGGRAECARTIEATATGFSNADNCLSGKLIEYTKLTSIFNVGAENPAEGPGAFPVETTALGFWEIILAGAMGSILLLTTAFVFFAAGIMLILRVVILIILMIISPLAFAGAALPATEKYARMWWEMLFKQVFFVPLYLLMVVIAYRILADDGFRELVMGDGLPENAGDFAGAFKGYEAAAGIFIYFIIAIGLMVAALLIAKNFGAIGAKTAVTMGGNLRKWGQGQVLRGAGASTAGLGGYAARNTFGRAANAAGESRWLANRAARGGITGALAGGTIRGLDRTAASSFDLRRIGGLGKKMGVGEGAGKGGYNQQLKDQVKRREEMAKRLARTPKNSTDRQEEEKLRVNLRSAEEAARTAVDETTKKAAESRVTVAKKALKVYSDNIERRGKDRKEEYSKTLANEGFFFGYGKVARKDKEAADQIRKGKSPSDKIKDAVKEIDREESTPQQQTSQEGGQEEPTNTA